MGCSGVRYLYKIFHEKSSNDFNDIYVSRFHYESTIHSGLNIKPLNQRHIYKLYYVPTNEMLSIIHKIHLVSRAFQNVFETLPAVAQQQFVNECLVEELYSTNDLEGIRSSREEIAKSAKEVIQNKKSKKRFESMIESYLRLLNNNTRFPQTPMDVRRMYDDVTDGEVDPTERPDGEIFRKDTTYILKKSGSGKVIHQGITPETEISHAMHRLLDFMNNESDVPSILKVAIGHFYFGYIHPFYDGNGRTSRFISSLYLSKELGNISAISLSRGCNTYRSKYLDAFEMTNSIRSRGEMNYFIETLLKIIADTLVQMNAELKEKAELLHMSLHKLDRESLLDPYAKEYKDVMFVLAQHHFFDSGNGLTVKELAGICSKSEATIRKLTKELLALSLIEQRGEKPAYFYIKPTYLQK